MKKPVYNKWVSRKFLSMLVFTLVYVAVAVRFLVNPDALVGSYLNVLTPSWVAALLVFGGLEVKQKQIYKK